MRYQYTLTKTAKFKIIKTPKNSYTRVGYFIGNSIQLDYDTALASFKSEGKILDFVGQGSYAEFYPDELELIEIHYRESWIAKPSDSEISEMRIAQFGMKEERKQKLKQILGKGI